MRTIFLLSAVCALCLPFAGCTSGTDRATDAAPRDAIDTREAQLPDVARDGTGTRDDASPPPGDTPSQPKETGQEVADALLLDVATDGPTQTSDLDNDATTDVGAPSVDPAADARADMRVADGASTEVGCSGWTALKRLSPAEAADLIATSDPIVINVHIPYAGDIPGTDTSIPFNNVDAIEAYLDHDLCADVLLVCHSGGMSLSAGNELVKRGYLRVRDLNGGMLAWESAGYSLLKDGSGPLGRGLRLARALRLVATRGLAAQTGEIEFVLERRPSEIGQVARGHENPNLMIHVG